MLRREYCCAISNEDLGKKDTLYPISRQDNNQEKDQ